MGLSVAATRQKAGRPVSGLPSGGVKVPLVILAIVMVACGKWRRVSPAQLAPWAG